MTISIKKIKDILSTALTALMIVVLFGAIFVATKMVELTWNYVFECFIVIVIAVEIKLLWYPFGEEKPKVIYKKRKMIIINMQMKT